MKQHSGLFYNKLCFPQEYFLELYTLKLILFNGQNIYFIPPDVSKKVSSTTKLFSVAPLSFS